MLVTVAVIATVSAAVLGTTTVAGAARTAGSAGICKTFSASGLKIAWSVIGNMTCSKAKPYLVKFLAHRGKPDVKVVLTGPTGFKCFGTDDAKGRASVGACYSGTLKFPNNGFQWFG